MPAPARFQDITGLDFIHARARGTSIWCSRLTIEESISSLQHKGFCNRVTLQGGISLLRFAPAASIAFALSDVASNGIAAAATVHFADRFGDHFWRGAVASDRLIRADRDARGGKPACRVPTQQSARHTELIENSVTKQRLAMKIRSRLRVICATPFQKRLFGHRSERFLYCVCRSLR